MIRDLFTESTKGIKLGKYELSYSSGEPGESGYIMISKGREFIGSISLDISIDGIYKDISELTNIPDNKLQSNSKLDSFINSVLS